VPGDEIASLGPEREHSSGDLSREEDCNDYED
jgi:hypothetical protein